MEACVVICRSAKPKARRGKVLFINAVGEVTRERAQSFLTDDHIQRIVQAYELFSDEPGFTYVASLEEIRAKDSSLNIPLYVAASASPQTTADAQTVTQADSLPQALEAWLASRKTVAESLSALLPGLTLPKLDETLRGLADSSLFDRKGWRKLPFGGFAQNMTIRAEPAEAADEIYVGLEHLDPQSLHLRRWGKGSDVIGIKLRFSKGDIIFGRRRAYQRKLVVAEFDGICSAHAMVIRAKSDVVLPEFLPFLMMSDKFMSRAMEISVGSLSPTISWTTLKNEEYELPPIEQQRRIAEVLLDADKCNSCLETTHLNFQKAYDVFADEKLTTANTSMTKLGQLSRQGKLDIQTGPFGTVLQASSYVKSGTPLINPVNMLKHRLYVEEGPFLDDNECNRLSRYKMRVGDILIGRKGDVGRAVLVVPEYEGYIVGSDIIRLRLINSEIIPEYFYYFMLAPHTRKWITRHASGTTMPGINEKLLNSIDMPIPTPNQQSKIIEAIQKMNRIEDALLNGITASKNLIIILANALIV